MGALRKKADDALADIEYWVVVYDVGGTIFKFCVTNEVRARLFAAYERMALRKTADELKDAFIWFNDISGARAHVPSDGYVGSMQSTRASREFHAKLSRTVRRQRRATNAWEDDDDDDDDD